MGIEQVKKFTELLKWVSVPCQDAGFTTVDYRVHHCRNNQFGSSG